MITLTKKQVNFIKEGELTSKEIAVQLVEKYSAIEIALAYVEEVVFRESNASQQPVKCVQILPSLLDKTE